MVLSKVHWNENTGGFRDKKSGIPEYLKISPTQTKPKRSEATGARKPGINKYRAIH
jgi:hypothetical protein